MSKQLLELGLLTGIDRAALAGYCQAWADWVNANVMLAKPAKEGGGMIFLTDNGYPMLSTWWTVANQSAKQMKSFMTEFGMTPASRSRMQVATDADKKTVESVLDDAVGDED